MLERKKRLVTLLTILFIFSIVVVNIDAAKNIQINNTTNNISFPVYTVDPTPTLTSTPAPIKILPIKDPSSPIKLPPITRPGNTPNSITNLINVSYMQTYINWTWTDPQGNNFDYVQIYIDGKRMPNVNKGIQFYNASGFLSDTEHTISTHTVNKEGKKEYINKTWVNATNRTAPTDITSPSTIITLMGNLINGWYNSSVEVNLTATDDMSGVANTKYRINSGDWNIYIDNFTINNEGITEIQYNSTDNAGNIEPINTVDIYIDSIPPLVDITGVSDGETYNTNVTPIITITDANLIFSQITLNGDLYESGTEISENGDYILNVTATDITGHITIVSTRFTIDKRPPVPPTCIGDQTNSCGFTVIIDVTA